MRGHAHLCICQWIRFRVHSRHARASGLITTLWTATGLQQPWAVSDTANEVLRSQLSCIRMHHQRKFAFALRQVPGRGARDQCFGLALGAWLHAAACTQRATELALGRHAMQKLESSVAEHVTRRVYPCDPVRGVRINNSSTSAQRKQRSSAFTGHRSRPSWL